jgi:RNA polymerase sigma-70 factor (sigma-E family)
VNRSQEAGFEQFVAAEGSRLLRLACLMTGDRGHAEDLVQTALERTARHWTRLEGAPGAYARTVLTHAATDRWRRRRARVTEVQPGPHDLPGPDDFAGTVAARHDLVVALRRLTPKQRALLVLRFFDDLSEADTARVLGISTGAVKSGTSRALDRLRTFIPIELTQEVGP